MKPALPTRNGPRSTPCTRASRESRCVCGSLLARLTAAGVELKCRRCKRIVLVRWSERAGTPGGPRDRP